MRRLSRWTAVGVTRFATCVALAAIGLAACPWAEVNAASVVVDISGNFGPYVGYGAPAPAPLDNGSFSGTVTFLSLPGANQTVMTTTADVNFYDSTSQLLFTVGGSGSFDQFTAGPTGYETLSVGGGTTVGGIPVSVASLVLSFDNWSFGSGVGTVQGYGTGSPPNFDSSIEYTYGTGGNALTYYGSVVSGQAALPEPSSIALGLFGMAGVFISAAHHRRRRATA